MNFCDTPLVLKLIMYFKYIIIISFILISFFSKKNQFLKKIQISLFLIILIYIILFLISYFLNLKINNCFIKSNPYNVFFNEKISKTHDSKNIFYSYDQYSRNIKPTEVKQFKNKEYDINIYNINYYPLNDVLFNFEESSKSYNINKSGNEIATLATIISSLNKEDNINPITIIEKLKYDDNFNSSLFNMDAMLEVLLNYYDFRYLEITSDEIDDALDRDGIILTKVSGSSDDTIFTCSEGYILIINKDSNQNYYVANVNDKDHDTICPSNSLGFGNIILANNNDTLYTYFDVTANSERYYVLWR